jgi:hypothetical protein
VLQATFIVNDIKNNNICQDFDDIGAILYHIVVSLFAIHTIYISDKCLNLLIKSYRIEQRNKVLVFFYQFPAWSFEQHVK